MDNLKKNKGKELPIFLNAELFNRIVKKLITEQWTPLCDKLLDDIRNIFKTFLTNTLNSIIPSTFPSLSFWAHDSVLELAASLIAEAKLKIESIVGGELQPYTANHEIVHKLRIAPFLEQLEAGK